MSTSKHVITLDKAKELTSNYRKNKKKVLKDEYNNKATLPICETFERDAFDNLLARQGCAAVRFYYGMDEELNVKLIMVGVNEKDEDMLPEQSASDSLIMETSVSDGGAQLYDNTIRCPTQCPPDSSLNTD